MWCWKIWIIIGNRVKHTNIAIMNEWRDKPVSIWNDVACCLKLIYFDVIGEKNYNEPERRKLQHFIDVIMNAIASQITGVSIVFLTVCSRVDQRKHQCPSHWPLWRETTGVDSPQKWPVTRKMFSFDDVIMDFSYATIRVRWCRWHFRFIT